MKYFYDRVSDSLYLTLADRPYGDSVEAAPGVVLDFDAEGRLLGVDLERASRTVDVTDLEIPEEPAGVDVNTARVNGAGLKRQREALGLSQVELARKLSVSSNTIARWERGELKIEHPAMLQLAMAALRDAKTHRPKPGAVLPGQYEKRVGRSTVTGRFFDKNSEKRPATSDRKRAKKK